MEKKGCRAQMAMDKFGVDEQQTDAERFEKAAAEGCPQCGQKVEKHGKVIVCPKCGSEPFEPRKR